MKHINRDAPAFQLISCNLRTTNINEGFNDWGGRGYDDFVPGEVPKTVPSGDRTT